MVTWKNERRSSLSRLASTSAIVLCVPLVLVVSSPKVGATPLTSQPVPTAVLRAMDSTDHGMPSSIRFVGNGTGIARGYATNSLDGSARSASGVVVTCYINVSVWQDVYSGFHPIIETYEETYIQCDQIINGMTGTVEWVENGSVKASQYFVASADSNVPTDSADIESTSISPLSEVVVFETPYASGATFATVAVAVSLYMPVKLGLHWYGLV